MDESRGDGVSVSRGLTLVFVLLAGVTGAAEDRPMTIAVWGGSFPVVMAGLRGMANARGLGTTQGWVAAYGGVATAGSTGGGRGWGGGWEAGHAIGRHAGFGIRLGAFAPPDLRATFAATGGAGERETYDERIAVTGAVLLAGAWIGTVVARRLHLQAGAWAGPAWAGWSDRLDTWFEDPNAGETSTNGWTTAGAGSGYAVLLEAEAAWTLPGGLAVFAALGGWRGSVGGFRYARDADRNGDGLRDARRGEPVRDAAGRQPGLDLNGVAVRAGVRLTL